jgi:hypothetical protein
VRSLQGCACEDLAIEIFSEPMGIYNPYIGMDIQADGTLWLAYYAKVSTYPHYELVVQHREPDGWSRTTSPTATSSPNDFSFGVANDGHWWIAYPYFLYDFSLIMVLSSYYGDWSAEQASTPSLGSPMHIEIDTLTSNFPVITSVDRDDSTMVVTDTSDGNSWNHNTVPYQTGPVGQKNALVTDGEGNLHLLFNQLEYNGNLRYERRDAQGNWFGSDLAPSTVGPLALAIDSNNRPHALQAIEDGIRYIWLDGYYQEEEIQQEHSGPLALAVDARGNPHALFSSTQGANDWIYYATRDDHGWIVNRILYHSGIFHSDLHIHIHNNTVYMAFVEEQELYLVSRTID